MKIVKYGMEGYEVKLLQYALSRAGLDAGNPDGIFGRRTAKALQRFQRDKGLAADAVAGKLTWAALYPFISGYTLHLNETGTAEPVLLDLPVVTDRMPCSHLLTCLMLKGLTMRYPFMKVYEIGRSVMGRPIHAVSLGEGQRQVGYVGPHCADQWTDVWRMLVFLESYAQDTQEFLGSNTMHLVPLVNPDGVDLVTGALEPQDSFYTQARALSAHYPDMPFPEDWLANILGVDLRLQYPTGWEMARRVRFRQGFTRPGPRDYPGGEPLIAPETRAIARWTREHDFAAVLSYDEGYTGWFKASWGRPAYVLEKGSTDILPALEQALT